tara:strand:+ start:1777 stop:3960 length:2184 start_codon:yes stop_codon:yes gene_type:complete
VNTTIAKLLAKEDLTVKTGNYSTAWFDIKNRVLGLPAWKDKGKDVTDLLIGHEVGHALYTPFEGWHDSPEKLEGCPRSYINVVEDARIEKKIKKDYPGLVGPMSRGYKKLVADEFFGDVDNIDWDKVKLIDKINLEAKIGNLIDVPMNDSEKALFNKTMTTEEFSEVLDVVREILAYTKENQEELLTPPEMPDFDDNDFEDENNEDPTQQGHDDMENNNEQEEDTTNEESSSNDENAEDEEEDLGTETTSNPEPEHTEEDVSITDEIFRKMEKSLIPESTDVEYGNEVSKAVIESAIVKHEDLMKQRLEHFNKVLSYHEEEGWYGKEYKDGVLTLQQEVEFADYIKKAKKSIVPAVKEFEQKKASHRWMHAQTAKTGRIDVNRLHSYKLSDDIFSKTTRLADAKNHGMFMLIDYSGSMSGQLHGVLEQVIHSVLFCKAVNIPFDVYAFTTGNHDKFEYADGDVGMDNLSMPQLIHSGLKKNDFETALKWLYARTEHGRGPYSDFVKPQVEDWGSTPLNVALIASHKLIKQFKYKHALENVTLLSITDGDTNGIRICEDRRLSDKKISMEWSYSRKIHLTIDGKKVILPNPRVQGTKALYQNLKKRYGISTMGFFIADGSKELNHRLHDAYCDMNKDDDSWYSEEFQEFRKQKIKENTKQKCIELHNANGYDNYFIVRGDKFNVDVEDDFSVDTDASDNQIRTAFKKYSSNKKTNKNLMTKFGKAVAL